jgi:carboxypeptidase C (cathepsin A)
VNDSCSTFCSPGIERQLGFSVLPLSWLILAHSVDGKQKCVNIYDVRLEDDKPACGMNWPPEIHNVTRYLDVSLLLLCSELSLMYSAAP